MYADYIQLNKQEVLKRVSQEEIYNIVTGYLPIANKYVKSPLREKDKLAGAYYEWVRGNLLFKDWADPNRKIRDCFQLLMDKFNLTFNEALLLVDEHFKLGIYACNPSPVLYQFIDYSSKANRKIGKSKRTEKNNIIETLNRGFNNYDKLYWFNRFGISKDNLIEDLVFPIIKYKFFSPKRNEYITIRPMDICYSFNEFQYDYKKIYRPLNETNKWITNCTENHIGNIDNLPIMGNKLIIQKAYKDCRIVRNIGIRNTVWFQSESMFPIDEYLIPLCKRFEKILILYDNDEAGIIGGKKLVDKINSHLVNKAIQVFIPDNKIKDLGILYEKQGNKQVEQFLKTIY